MVAGRKIIGSAQLRKNGVILQQNSLPLQINFPLWDEVFFRSDWQHVADSGAVDLWLAAGREIAHDEVVEAICDGFRSVLGITFVNDALTDADADRARTLQPDYAC